MKRHDLIKVILITLAIVVVLSWVLPLTYYSSNGLLVEDDPISPIGMFELMSNGIVSVQYFGHIAIFMLVVGGLYGVLHKIPGYRNLLDTIVNKVEGFEYLFMALFIILFGLLSAGAGLSLPLMLLFPFVISLVLMMGYDKITATLVTAGSTVVGLIGSMFSARNTEGIDMILGTSPDGLVLEKALLFFVGIALLIIYTVYYARKHKINKDEVKSEFIPNATKVKQKSWPIVVVLDVIFFVSLLGFVSWNVFGITIFDKVLKYFNEFKIFDIQIYDSLFGLASDTNSFGNWTLSELSLVVVLASAIIALCYKVKLNDYLTNFFEGAKRAIKPAVLLIFIYTILVSVVFVPTLLTLVRPILDVTEGFNTFTMAISAFISSVFSVELGYAASNVLPYVATSTYAASNVDVISLIWQAMYGVSMLVAPTSVILMITLGYLHVPYLKWLKSVWKLLLALVVLLLVIFTILPMI